MGTTIESSSGYSLEHIERGKVLADTTLKALRVTVISLRNCLRLKDTPLFDQITADELNRRQKEYIRILLELRKQGVQIDITVTLKQGVGEKLNSYSRNPISIILPAEQPLGPRITAKTRLSDLGGGSIAERLELLGEKTITEDEPLSYLKRTCFELSALRQDIKTADANGQRKSAKTQKLKSLEYTIIRSRLLEMETAGLTPEGATVSINPDPRSNISVNVSVPIGHSIKKFHYLVLGTIITADPKAGGLLEKIKTNGHK